ncbi:MAG: hypothetical protein HY436_01000, partial [Candidatus Liptonbacteria bacterium]|nr:hypothetical protein [Candidatus Liptonbacteria bacterium]
MGRTVREAKPASRRATLGSRIRWIRIVRPQEEDLAWLHKTFGIHSLILDELKGPSARESAQALGKYLYLVYYFPIYDTAERVSRRSEVDFLITAHGVITVSYEPIDALEQLAKTLPPGSRAFTDTLTLTHKLIETLLLFQQRQLVHIREKVEGISAELFKYRERERERSLLERISYLKRDISQYHIIVSPQKHVLE